MASKEIVLYACQPYKKMRWIGYASTIQIGFLMFSMFLTPTKKIIEERQAALATKAKRDEEASSDEPLADATEKESAAQNSATILQRLKQIEYREIFSLQNIKENVTDRPYMTVGLLATASTVTLALNIYVRRMAHVITLLPNQRIRFESFSAFGFGKPPRLELPVTDVACVVGRSSKTNYSILKFKGYLGYHLLHKSDGIFFHPKLFDEYLGYSRSWHKR